MTTIKAPKDVVLEEPAPDAHKRCSYHKDIVALKHHSLSSNDQDMGSMERFLEEKPSEQSAIVAVGENYLNIKKGCTCLANATPSTRKANL